MPKFNDFQTLLTAAEAYFYLGYAVIPLLGDFDLSRPKVAARAWSVYQQRLATLDEINQWFSPTGAAGGLGIVTGRISRLAVLDFDSGDLFADFRSRFPDLIETRTVQSAGRGLPHLYFHIPSHLYLASQKRQGIDLLSDGRYVVAPPTTINGQTYRITRGGMPRLLTAHDIQRLQSFVANQKAYPSAFSINVGDPTPFSTQREVGAEDIPSSVRESLRPSPTPKPFKQMDISVIPLPIQSRGGGAEVTAPPSRSALHGLYHYWRSKCGRNEALFRTALYARDHGCDQTQTRSALASLHVSQSGLDAPMETQAVRQREAYATIRSVFSRPSRTLTPSPACGEGSGQGLPNSVREALMQRKLTNVIRTLEGLQQAGFHPGKGFTADQAIRTLKGIVGRDSVYNALNALAPNGQPIFPQRVPSALPLASNEAANQKQPLKTKKCFFVTKKKSGIKKRGIQPRLFKLPQTKDLCRLLGVKSSGSDLLTRDDLLSAHQTRMALHRELIKRRPGEYSRRWLANRLGVSRRTINTYNQRIPIHCRATYYETALSWTNIDNLLNDEALAGAFIETLTGKKYPALRSIAAHLLAKGTYIRLKQRSSSLYWYGSSEPPPNILTNDHKQHEDFSPQRHKVQKERDYENQPYPKLKEEFEPHRRSEHEDHKEKQNNTVGTRPVVSALPPQQPHRMLNPVQGKALAPLPVYGEGLGVGLSPAQQETLAQTIYAHIDGLSLKNARKLARSYSEKHIHFALNRLRQRTNVANPGGFFVSILRSTARMEQK